MKKILIIATVLSFCAFASYAQRIGIVDSKAILEKMPDYNTAQGKLDKFSEQWETEIKTAFAKVEKMYKTYQAESAMLDAQMKQNRENEIMNKEKEAKELQKKYFGFEGELFKKREELIKPIQDRIYNAIQQLATKESYDLILDKSSGATVFYNNPTMDINNKILKILEIK